MKTQRFASIWKVVIVIIIIINIITTDLFQFGLQQIVHKILKY